MLTMKLKEHDVCFGKETTTVNTYEIGSYIVEYMETIYANGVYKTITILPNAEYAPSIRYDKGYRFRDEDNEPKFVIQTTAYGAKEPAEIEKIIAGYQEALEVVKVLTEKFCD